ncbi:MAG: hypothetical protein AAGC88_15975, partial [Bacteroidota bacterium]
MIDTSLDSSNFYFLIAVVQGFILTGIILLQKPRNIPNLLFSILVFVISLQLLQSILEESISQFNAKYPIPLDLGLMLGPLTYFHILHIKDPYRKFTKRDLIHFLPSLVMDVMFFTGGFLYIRAHLEWANANIPLIQAIALCIAGGEAIQMSIYTFFIYQESQDSKAVLKEFNQVKKWISTLITVWSVLIVFVIVAVLIGLIFIQQLDDNSALLYKPMGIILSLCIYILGYSYMLKYAGALGSYMGKIKKFKFNSDEIDQKKNEIIDAFNRDEVYRDTSLTVAKLAGHLGWPINSVSKMINESLHTNFNDLVNRYRVEAFKQLAVTPESQRYSVQGLGQEVGFSSKASF